MKYCLSLLLIFFYNVTIAQTKPYSTLTPLHVDAATETIDTIKLLSDTTAILKKAKYFAKKYKYSINTAANAPFRFRVNAGFDNDYMSIRRDDENRYWEIFLEKIDRGKIVSTTISLSDKTGKSISIKKGTYNFLL